MKPDVFDVAVVGAGVFGSWITYLLQLSGAKVILIDAYGAGNSRSSSGGESRIIRMGYGPDDLYSRSALRSLVLWKKLFALVEPDNAFAAQQHFRHTGVLWLARSSDAYCEDTLKVLQALQVPIEKLTGADLGSRYSQFDFSDVAWGILETESGALMARRAVQAVAAQSQRQGAIFISDKVQSPGPTNRVESIQTESRKEIIADKFIFACGPWLPKLFPEILTNRIHVTRQEVNFFGTPAGDETFSAHRMPIWVDFNDLVYAIPNLDNRGFKLAIDAHGPEFDPDTGNRMVTAEGIEAARAYLRKRVPALADAPIVESRVCQYENTSNGDFLIDRHPQIENVWLVGGGSGHGFKHGPAVAEYTIGLLDGGGRIEPQFALATKQNFQQRQVY